MKIKFIENAVFVGKCLVLSIKTSYRAIRDHPFLVVFVLFSYLLHNFHPLVFLFLLNASPVIICTTLLLGLLLSYGEPLIPEIEDEEKKTACDFSKLQVNDTTDNFVIRRDDKLLLEIHNIEDVNRDFAESSWQVQAANNAFAIPEDGRYGHGSMEYNRGRDFTMLGDSKRVNREGVGTGTSSVIEEKAVTTEGKVLSAEGLGKEQPNDDAHKVDGCVECASGVFSDHSVKTNGVRMDFDEGKPGTSCYSHLHSKRNRLAELGDFSDSNSDGAESSSPDASMADILPMLEEFHPLLDSELSRPVHININDSDDTFEVSSEDEGGDYSSEEEVAEHQEAKVHGEGEENSQAVMAWTANDLKNVMDLGISEHERNQVLERLMAKQNARRNAEAGNLMYLDHSQPVSQVGRYTGFQISPISTRRMDPFDRPNDSNENKGLPPIPSSAPSALLRRRNPFEFPLPQAGDSNMITVDWPIHQQCSGRDLMSHGYISGGPFSADNLPSMFLQEKSTSDETSYAAFRKQLSEMSDSKPSSISKSETLPFVSEQEYQQGLVKHDHRQENEVTKPSELDAIGTEEIKSEELPVSYAPRPGFYGGECGETASCSSEVADEDLDMAAKNKSSSTLEEAVSVQYALLSKSTDERDERSHAESISYSGFPQLGTSTVDDDTLLEPLLSPDKGNLQQNFETFARQRSSKQVFFQIESMEDDSDDDESVHLASDEAESSALDGKVILSTEGDVALVAERTMNEFVIPGYYGESQNVQQFPSYLEMEKSRTADEQPSVSAGLKMLEYPKVPADDPAQEQLIFNQESTDRDDNQRMEILVDMHPDDDTAIFPAAFTKDHGFIGIYTTHPVKDLDSFTFSQGQAETLMVDSLMTFSKKEDEDLSESQGNGLIGDSHGISAGNNDLRGQDSVSSGLDAVGDYIVEKSSSDITQNDQMPQLQSNSEEEALINNVTSEPDVVIISEDKTCLESTMSHSDLPEVEAQSVEDLHVLKQLTEAGIDSPKNLSELSPHKIAGKESDTSHHSLEPSQADLKLVDVHSDPHEVKLQPANDLDSAVEKSGSPSTEHIGGIQPEKLDLSSDLHEIEAKSHEDIHLAFKRLSEGIADDDSEISASEPSKEQMDQKMEISSDVHKVEAHSSAETLQNDSDPCATTGSMMLKEESESDLHEVEGRSLDDIHFALKRLFRQSTFKNGRESKDTSAEFGEIEDQAVPKLQYASREVEPQTPRDLNLALKRLFRQNTFVLGGENESGDMFTEIGGSENQIDMETNFHEVEAQTLDDIHSAMKQFIRQNTIVLNDQTEELPSELGEGDDGLVEPELEKHSDMHDVEAKSYNDLNSSFKQMSDGTVESSEKEFEFEDASSDFDHTERHVESDEEIYSGMHEAEAKFLDDTSSKQQSDGTIAIPDRVTEIDMSSDVVTAENESAESGTTTK